MPDKLIESCITVGLINNMPDAALESTERQFSGLLRAAGEDVSVRLKLFSLPDVPRMEYGRQQLDRNYSGTDTLWNCELDGLIVTGAEPRASSLQDEPYWESLTKVIDWAEDNTISTIWSCLAAHAAVLHLDGISRNALGEKQFGVFDCEKVLDHPLLSCYPARSRISHSRCNELRADALAASGYTILTRSPDAGVDMFVKQRNSLFVFLQGHPEYDERALLREYRRDVGRYLRNERETYPTMPQGYFDDVSAMTLDTFRYRALSKRSEKVIDSFPMGVLEDRLSPGCNSAAKLFYQGWLSYLSTQKAQRSKFKSYAAPRSVRLPVAPHPVQGLG